MRLIDRYVIREVLLPFVIGLLVFTFMLIIPYIIELAEILIAKAVSTMVILQVMATLLPMALSLSIPMALLLGLLVAFGRLSSDREFVAMQACGVSLVRLMRPVALLSVLAWAATSYTIIVGIPNANQDFREVTYRIVADRAEGEVRPRVFFADFPNVVLYVREIPPTGGWNDIFMADTRPGRAPAIYLAKHGSVLLDAGRRTVEMTLANGTSHTADADGKYEVAKFDQVILSVNPDTVFPREGPDRGVREMTIAELQTWAAELEAVGDYPHTQYFEIQKKFSIPFACIVFGLIGLGLGATNRRDGKLASFVIGIGVILVYYVILYLGQALNVGHLIPPWVAAWSPNIVLGAAGIWLLVWRNRAADQPWRFRLPFRLPFRRRADAAALAGGTPAAPLPRAVGARASRPAVRITLPDFALPLPGILDRYVAASYVRIVMLSVVALGAMFYLAVIIDNVPRVFRGNATWAMLWSYLGYATPQNIYYVLPLAVLLGTLVTIGLLTKNSELIIMKACGISLYRVALPMLAGALIAGGVLFMLEESVLGPSNRRAEAILHVMRGGSPDTFDVFNRRWIVGSHDEIYNYEYYDPRERRLSNLSIYEFTPGMQALKRRTFVERATFAGEGSGEQWRAERGWTREFDEAGETLGFTPFAETQLAVEPLSYFGTQQPDSQFMGYMQLRDYIVRLQASGFDVTGQRVDLARKLSFPFVTIVMTLIAVPFAVTTGRRGAMYGIGVGILLAITYFVTMSVFGAIGAAGMVSPLLAAWAPNLLFGAGAGYLLLTVRT